MKKSILTLACTFFLLFTGIAYKANEVNILRNFLNKKAMRYMFSMMVVGITALMKMGVAQTLPIKPSRTISFTTNEGSYMNVDISPDGKTLVFDLLGDLYTIPVTGGKATQLTRGMAINQWPLWSPDGKSIAYISDYSGDLRINIRNPSGTFHTVLDYNLTREDPHYRADLIWTPDGRSILSDGFFYNLKKGKTPLPQGVEYPVGFSKDGNLIYYTDHSGLLKMYNLKQHLSFTISLPSEKIEVGSYKIGGISPDGRYWAYVYEEYNKKKFVLIVNDLLSHTSRELVSSILKKDTLQYNRGEELPYHFTFSPDSKNIFIGYGGKIHRIDVAASVDDVLPFSAKVNVDMGPLNYNSVRIKQETFKANYTRSANTSPDGKHIVFMAFNKIYEKDLPQGQPHVLVPQPFNQYQPIYSPDGKWIAYVSWCDTTGGEVWRVPASGGRPQQLTHSPAQYQRPAWSPDGKYIAIVKGGPSDFNQRASWSKGEGIPLLGDRDDPGIGQLELISVTSGRVKAIADSVPLWNQLVFSQDGNRLIYEAYNDLSLKSDRKFMSLLQSRDLNGKNEQILAGMTFHYFNGMGPSYILQRSFSPDGQFIVYSMAEDLFLVPVSRTAEPTLIYDSIDKFTPVKFASGVDPYWEKGGKVLSWSYGNKFYRIDPYKIMAKVQQGLGNKDDKFITVAIKPDQVVSLNVTASRYHGHGILALKNARVITMHGKEVIAHGTVIIKDGRFAAIGQSNSTKIPTGAKIFDLKGKTIMPGFVDLHLHMRLGRDIFPQQSWMYLVNLAYGVTTARDPSSTYDSFGYAELLESGQMTGPRLFSSGCPVRLNLEGIPKVDNLADALSIVQKRKELGGTFIKQYALPTRIQREWLLLASRSAGLDMTNEGAYDPIWDLGMLKDGSSGIEHNPDWDEAYKDISTLFAKSGTYFTPTLQVRANPEAIGYFDYHFWREADAKLLHLSVSDAQRGEFYKTIIDNIPRDTTTATFLYASQVDAQIRHFGGKVTLGSHGNDQGIGVHNELWALQAGGLSNMEALQAATIMGAEAIGIQKDVGSIEVGKIADLIILNKNPLEDIHNSREIKCVMKDGILYDGDTLDEIWPIVKKCPEWRLSETIKKQKK